MSYETPGENVERVLRTLGSPTPRNGACRNCAERGRAMRRALEHADHLQQVCDEYEERMAVTRNWTEAGLLLMFPFAVYGAIQLIPIAVRAWEWLGR